MLCWLFATLQLGKLQGVAAALLLLFIMPIDRLAFAPLCFFCAAGQFCVNCILRSTNAQNEVIWPFWDYLKVQLSMENMLYGSCSCFWSPPLVWWWPLVIWRRTCRHKKKKNHPKLPSGGFKAMAKLGMADTAFPVASDQWTAPPLPTHPPFPFARISWLSWCRRIVGLISITSNGF